jgi:MFS family permease
VLAGLLARSSFLLLFALDAATTLAFGFIVLLGVPESRPTATTASSTPDQRWGLFAPFRNRAFLAFALVQWPVLLIFQQGAVALPLDMRAQGLEPAQVGRLLALNGIAVVLLQPFAVRLSTRYSLIVALVLGAALTGVGFGMTGLAGGPAVFGAAILVWTLGEIAFSTATPALIADLAPVQQRGRYQGAFQLTWGVAGVVAPALGGAVLGAWGAGPLWASCLVLGLTAALFHGTLTARTMRQRTGPP